LVAQKILYKLLVTDIQNVAEQELGRPLHERELEIISNNLGDYINWYDAIAMTINNHVLETEKTA
jgi:hypothetical protein